ncbi:MAG: WD40/YVTN/BNR-like repeat-containing protein [Haloglomus sp.]
MLLAGTENGLHRLTDVDGSTGPTVRTVFDSGAVMRLRAFEAHDGVVAATKTGLYHSTDGGEWTNLDVPREQVYAVGAAPDGRLYAGTRPAHVYVARADSSDALGVGELEWRELEGLQEVPSREEWRLPRHENLAQVRDVHVHPEAPERVVAGVEVGGVHVSNDGETTWTERRERVHDDVHELAVLGPDEFVAATGYGLFHTTDAGRSWARLDEGYDQRYFRSVSAVGDAVYAGGALAHTSTWLEPDADPELFVYRGGERVEPVEHPRPDETVTGITEVDGDAVVGTHRGSVLRRGADGWSVVGSLPAPDDFAGSYTPLLWMET